MSVFFFFNDTATTEIYTLSLHDALPICPLGCEARLGDQRLLPLLHAVDFTLVGAPQDRKSTRLNSSHSQISYAVFCLKKKRNPRAARSHAPAASLPPTKPPLSRRCNHMR